MQSSTNTTTHHPLHLLDDLLTSITTTSSNCMHTQNTNDIDGTKDTNSFVEDDNTISLAAEAKQDLVLRAANELFGSNMSLLENALALLDEQEQYQRDHNTSNSNNNNMEIDDCVNTTPPLPVIRRIKAKRSGRTAILVRKTRKKSSYKSKSNNASPSSHQVHSNTNGEKKQSVVSTTDEYYLCLMGREKIDRRTVMNSNSNNNSGSSAVWCKVQRQGAHCTCRSFSQNIKGGNSRSSSSSPKRNNDSSTQLVVNSNAVVCKHLLAAILLPHMLPWSKPGCELEDEIVDDREFAKLISKASIG